MYWTLELASYLSDAPWPANKDELIDYSIRTGAPLEVVENLQLLKMKMVMKFMNPFKKSGLIFQLKMIIFGMKKNINL